jgi:hypothetical protein
VTTDGAPLTTFQLDTADITGNIAVQGATAATANTVEWYNVPFEDLKTGNVINQLDLTNSTERLGINVAGYHPYIRLELNFSNGELAEILYR